MTRSGNSRFTFAAVQLDPEPHHPGDQIRVEQKMLFQNRDYAVLNEYRAVLGGLFRRIYGLGDDRLQKIFPDVKPKELTLV
jgi:hypothetical protein